MPARAPPQVPPTDAVKPESGVTENVVVAPIAMVTAMFGVMLPLGPAEGLTEYASVTLTVPDAGPVPIVFVAVTEQVYVPPFARPTTTIGELVPMLLCVPQVAV